MVLAVAIAICGYRQINATGRFPSLRKLKASGHPKHIGNLLYISFYDVIDHYDDLRKQYNRNVKQHAMNGQLRMPKTMHMLPWLTPLEAILTGQKVSQTDVLDVINVSDNVQQILITHEITCYVNNLRNHADQCKYCAFC
uniref:Cytochrome P450 n=1 Tax=Panagrellus redivivus TaxID=6233 RepID=A0A7E4V979_PANRE